MLLLNLPWLALPAATIVRMAREHPFTSYCRSDGQAHSPGSRSPPATFSAMSSKERIRSSMS